MSTTHIKFNCHSDTFRKAGFCLIQVCTNFRRCWQAASAAESFTPLHLHGMARAACRMQPLQAGHAMQSQRLGASIWQMLAALPAHMIIVAVLQLQHCGNTIRILWSAGACLSCCSCSFPLCGKLPQCCSCCTICRSVPLAIATAFDGVPRCLRH
jgi:hypothetical protein